MYDVEEKLLWVTVLLEEYLGYTSMFNPLDLYWIGGNN